jgi:F-type H+-transporting ATPase subunit b
LEIDWFTVIAQIFNFLLLLFLLKRFLYKPIIEAMDKREKSITEREETAREKTEKASEQIEDYRSKIERFDEDKDEMLKKVRNEAGEKTREIIEKSRKDFEEKEKRWKKSFENQKEEFILKLRRRVSEIVAETTRKVLGDMADARLEKMMVEIFIGKIRQSTEDEKDDELFEAIKDQRDAVEVTSAFELDNEDKSDIKKCIDDLAGTKNDIDFKIDKKLIAGIEINLEDYRISWNVFEYLEDFEEKLLDEVKT